MTLPYYYHALPLLLAIIFLSLCPSTIHASKYCGTTYKDANTKCRTACPTGYGCPEGEICFFNTNCNKDTEIAEETMVAFQSSLNGETGVSAVHATFQSMEYVINNKLFLYETPMMEWVPSTVYKFEGFFDGLKVMHEQGVAGLKIYLGGHESDKNNDCAHCYMYGLVNVAAFLAQAMKETIRYDACDENSWDRVGEELMYPISNSCGQLGQSYQDYHCSEDERHMECEIDPQMTITAVTNAKWWGAPGPLMCGPRSKYPQTGYWDFMYQCDNIWANPPETCDAYVGQEGGKAINNVAYPNAAGRTDVEGCCWWGRGVIQTSGVCNFGKLNYFLGKRASDDSRESRYPTIDFCKDPEAICSNKNYPELKWIAGFFYWVNEVQTYDEDGWNYIAELHKFVEGGMVGSSFIDAVSGIVNRGCHNPPCGTGELDGGPERAQNFNDIVQEMKFAFVDVTPVDPVQVVKPPPPPAPMPSSSVDINPSPTGDDEPSASGGNDEPAAPASITVPQNPPTPPPVSHPAESFLEPETGTSDSSTTGQSSVFRFTCGDGFQDDGSHSFPPSAEVAFDYELHNSIDTTVMDALKDVKESMLTHLAQKMGCQEGRRRLQYESDDMFGSIIGMQSNQNDLPDPNASGCIVEVDLDTPTSCTPAAGGFTIYAKQGTFTAELTDITNAIKQLVQTGMDSGQYETFIVDKAIYIGDREKYTKAQASPPMSITQAEGDELNNKNFVYAISALSVACFILLCLLCFAIRRSRQRRDFSEHFALNKWAMDEEEINYQHGMQNGSSINMTAPQAGNYRDYQAQPSQDRPPPAYPRQMMNQSGNRRNGRRNVFESESDNSYSKVDQQQPSSYDNRSRDNNSYHSGSGRLSDHPVLASQTTNQVVPDYIEGHGENVSQWDPSVMDHARRPQRSRSAPRFQNDQSRRRTQPQVDRRAMSDNEGMNSSSSDDEISADDVRRNNTQQRRQSAPAPPPKRTIQQFPRQQSSNSGREQNNRSMNTFDSSTNSSSAMNYEERQKRMAQARARASRRRSNHQQYQFS